MASWRLTTLYPASAVAIFSERQLWLRQKSPASARPERVAKMREAIWGAEEEVVGILNLNRDRTYHYTTANRSFLDANILVCAYD